MKKSKPIIDGIQFDSNEEVAFYYWLKEAHSHGIIEQWEYHPKPFTLSKPVYGMKQGNGFIQLTNQQTRKTKTILQDHVYTPDFIFKVREPWVDQFSFIPIETIYYEIKGTFSKFKSNQGFSIERKWVWDKYNILVYLVIPEMFFNKTWCPDACRWTPKRHDPVKKYIGFKTIEDFMKGE